MHQIPAQAEEDEDPSQELVDGGIDLSKPLNPYVAKHRRHYDCTFFLDTPILHVETAKSIAHSIALRLATLTHGRPGNHHTFKLINNFFDWLFRYLADDSADFKRSVKNSLAKGEVPIKDDWQKVMDDFRSAAMRLGKDNPISTTTCKNVMNSMLGAIRPYLKMMTSKGILPVFILKGIENAHKHGGRRKGLGELETQHLEAKDIVRIFGGYLQDSVAQHDIIEEERKECIHLLASSGLDIKGLSDAQIILEIKRVNKERLEELRRCSELDFLKGWEVYEEGQRLMEECGVSYERDIRPLMEDYMTGIQRGETKQWLENHSFRDLMFGKLNVYSKPIQYLDRGRIVNRTAHYRQRELLPFQERMGRFLTLLDGRYGLGVPIKESSDFFERPLQPFVYTNRLYDRDAWNASRDYLCLGIDIDTMLAAQIILLIDTGLNTEVVDELRIGCVMDTDVPTIKTVHGTKKRAGGKVVKGYVRLNDPDHKVNSIQVIERVIEMTKRVRAVAAAGGHPLYSVVLREPGVAHNLFVRNAIIPGSSLRTINIVCGLPHSVSDAIQRFKRRHPRVGAYAFTLGSIRPTVRLLDFMEGRNIETVRAQMGHASINMSTGYVVRSMSRMAMEQQIREFQNDLEAIMIFDIPGAAEKLGYTTEEYEERIANAERTGLGTVCDHLRKGADGADVSSKRAACDPVEDCPECPLMRVFPAQKENLVDAFLTRNWIRQNQEELQSHNSTRWEKVWMRWLAIVEGLIDKAKASHVVSRTILNEAENIAMEIGADGFLPLL